MFPQYLTLIDESYEKIKRYAKLIEDENSKHDITKTIYNNGLKKDIREKKILPK